MSSTKEDKKPVVNFTFAALDKFIEETIVTPEERKGPHDMILWGRRNNYPNYIAGLYRDVTTLKTIISGSMDYVAGNDVQIARGLQGGGLKMNCKGDSIRNIVRGAAKDYFLFGGFAFQVIRDRVGRVAEIYNLPLRHVRSNKHNTVFYYNEKWGELTVARHKTLIYPKFIADNVDEPTAVCFVKREDDVETYPVPQYSGAIKACEMERQIDDFHLNSLHNGFFGSLIFNFNNGVPTDQVKDEIESDFEEKFTGAQNAGRVGFSWNDSVQNRLTVDKIQVEDFGDKYSSLAKWARQQMFTAFRANPNLFGIPTDNLGFSKEEYDAAFELYNKTQIQPAQQLIVDTLQSIIGSDNRVAIIPFKLEDRGNG